MTETDQDTVRERLGVVLESLGFIRGSRDCWTIHYSDGQDVVLNIHAFYSDPEDWAMLQLDPPPTHTVGLEAHSCYLEAEAEVTELQLDTEDVGAARHHVELYNQQVVQKTLDEHNRLSRSLRKIFGRDRVE